MKKTYPCHAGKKTQTQLSDQYEMLLSKIDSLRAIAELGSIADFELTLDASTYTQIFINLEEIASQIKYLALELESCFFNSSLRASK